MRDSIFKDLKGWELLIDKQPGKYIIHCGTNDISKDADPDKIAVDIINLARLVSEESGIYVIISGLVPRKGYPNAKVRNVNNRLHDYCRNCMLIFLKYGNINAKTHCNISGLHLNSKGVSLFNENFVNLLYTPDSEN